jgi:tellurite resistance protein
LVGNPEAIGPLSTKALITKYEATEYSERLKEVNIGAQAAINVGGSISHSGGVSASAKGVGVSMSSTLSHDAGVSITKEAEFTVEGRLEQP